jgi:isopentenyl-diphosphate delta-isomerase type 1
VAHFIGKGFMTATKQTEFVILVDKNDNPIGTAEKLEAHEKNLCHRAFSVFIFRKAPKLELLLQRRALHKYHSPGLWTNTCCSHPRPGEDIIQAGQRRLKEEMGIETPLTATGKFHYIAHFDNGLVENEVDHVLIGFIDTENFSINKDEVDSYRWVAIADLDNEIQAQPKLFTPWLREALEVAKKYINS